MAKTSFTVSFDRKDQLRGLRTGKSRRSFNNRSKALAFAKKLKKPSVVSNIDPNSVRLGKVKKRTGRMRIKSSNSRFMKTRRA